MGIDWGVALGSAAKSGLDVYSKMKEGERLEALEKRQAEQFDAWRKEQALRAEEQAASKETYGKVGTENYSQAIQEQGGAGSQQAQMLSNQVAGMGAENEEASARSATNAMRQNVGKDQITSALPSQTYTREQAAEDYKKRMYGINPEKAMQSELTQAQLEAAGLSIKQSKRIEKRNEAEDEFSQWQQKSIDELSKDPVAYLESNLGAYNNAKKGSHLDDGYKAEIKKGADGSSSIVRTDSKGKVIDTTPITPQTAMMAFKEIAFDKYSSLPGKFKESTELGFRSREVGAVEKTAGAKVEEANIHKGFYGPGGVYERVNMAKVEQKTNEFGSKLPQAVRYSLDQQKTGLGKIEAQLALDPANKELQLNFGKNLLRYNQTLKDNGLDINIYDGTGIPSPQDAASQILNNKNLKPKDIESRIAAANYISPSYGTEVAKLISESKAPAPAASTTITKPNAAIDINTEKKSGGPKPIGPQMAKAADLRAEVTKVENRAQAIKVKEGIDTLTTQIKNAQEDPSMKPRQINALKLQLQSQQEQYNRLTKN